MKSTTQYAPLIFDKTILKPSHSLVSMIATKQIDEMLPQQQLHIKGEDALFPGPTTKYRK